MPFLLEGDEHEAFRRVFDRHRDEIFRFLYRLTGNAADADDLLQETFARLWRKRDQFAGNGSLAGYLRRIAYRTWLNARESMARHRGPAPLEGELMDGATGPAELLASRESRAFLLRRVRAEIEALPDEWRVPFLLFRYEGLSCAEVADALEITPKAVEMRLRRALQALAGRLKGLQAEYGT
jgi:RNA polymerase sigma-70 factor (ECF subfamily)